MDLNVLHARQIVLFGSPRALAREEFGRLLHSAGITEAERYSDDVAVVVEGRLVNPVEQAELDRLYETYGVVPVDINVFERALCTQLDPDRIMMSLKLARDRERLRSFLQNPHIDDAFFLRLLGLYDWGDDGFFDTDENRDVTAALIGRFYDGIERNHNIQYSTLGLMHLIAQNRNDELIRTLGTLPPLRRAVTEGDRQLRAILEALALHPATDETTLKHFIRRGDVALRVLVASRPGLALALQRELFESNEPRILTALTANPDLDPALADTLFEQEEYARNGYASVRLDTARFEKGLNHFTAALARNPSLTLQMQKALFASNDGEVLRALASNPSLRIADTLEANADTALLQALASNPSLTPEQLESLAQTDSCDAALAANPSAPSLLLEALYAKGETETLKALAANPSTPVTVLQQLQLDARFERAVRGNESFSAHIKRENIGWL